MMQNRPNPAAMEEERRKREQERQRAMAEQQRRREEEDRRRRQQEEEQRRRQQEREAEQARRAEELRKKREEEEVRRREQAAVLAVRKVIQRVRIANPETYDQLRVELEEAQAKHLEAMGAQADKVSQEAQQTLEQTQRRIEEIQKKHEEDERKKQEDERRKKEEAEKVDKLKEAIAQEVKDAEAKIDSVEADSSSFDKPELSPEEMIAGASKVGEAIAETCKVLEGIAKSMQDKWTEMGDNEAAWQVKREVQDMIRKVTDGKRKLETVGASAEWAKAKAGRKAAALRKEQERRDAFSSFDSDKDGKLSRAEVAAFAKAEFDFELSTEVLDKIMHSLEPLEFAKFRPLFQKVAIARSEAKAREERAEKERKAKILAEQKHAVAKIFEEGKAMLDAADAAVTKLEADAKPLAQVGADELNAEATKTLAAEVEKAASEARSKIEESAGKGKEITASCAENEALKGFDQSFVNRLTQRSSRIETRVEKVLSVVESAKEKAVRKAYAEMDVKRTACVSAIRAKMGEDGKSGEQYFKSLTDDDSLSKDKFVSLLGELGDLDLKDDQAEKLFKHIAGDDATGVSQERFLELIRLHYKCVKNTVMSEELTIKSKTVRRLDVGEILEILEGPAKEDGVGVQRAKCKAVQDEAIGWVTIAGNQGTAFLEPGGNCFTCVKETTLTDGLSIQDSKTVRKVAKGEVIEVLEFSKKDASLDIKRIKGLCKLDGATGWITVAGNQGTTYLEPC